MTGVAFVPQAPALVPELGRGLDAELGPVREACRTAIRRVAQPGVQLVLVGGADANVGYGPASRGSLAGFGVDLVVALGEDGDGPIELPPSLTVGAWLVRDALGPNTGATALSVDVTRPDLPFPDGDRAVVIVGDGSAARTEKAPGHLHPGAERFDASVGDALRSGEGDRLRLHPDDDRLMVAGWPAWTSMSYELEGSTWDAELVYEGAPFGVGYVVAAWTNRRA